MPTGFIAAALFAGSALCAPALTDLFRADFENCPSVPGDPIARVGAISTGALLSVRSAGSGITSVCLRVDGTSGAGVTNVWTESRSILAGKLSLRWEMNMQKWATDSNPVSVRLVFRSPTNSASTALVRVDFGSTGTVALGGTKLDGVQIPTNTPHLFRLDFDLDRSEGRLWMDNLRIGTRTFAPSLQYALDRVEFEMPAAYGSLIWLDNLSLIGDQPWVPMIAATFDAMPHGTLSVGDLPGYPVLDAITNIENGTGVYVTNSSSSRPNKTLRVGGSDVTIDLAPNGPALDGKYLLSFAVMAAGTNCAAAVRVKQSSRWIAGALLQGTNLLAYDSNTNDPFVVAGLSTNTDRVVAVVLDTTTNVYDLFVDGRHVVTNGQIYQSGLPEGVRITTDSDPSSPIYLDNIVFARRGRTGLYALEASGTWRSVQEFDSPLSELERINVLESGGSPHIWLADGTFGADGSLYIADPFAGGLRVFDPYALTPLAFYTDANMVAPSSIAAYRNGRLAVLDGTNILVYSGTSHMGYETTLVSTVSNNISLIRLSRDGRWLLAASTAAPYEVHRYNGVTGQYLGAMHSVTSLDVVIDDAVIGPNDNLCLLDTAAQSVFVFDYRTDESVDTLTDADHLHIPWGLAFLDNGNIVVSDLDGAVYTLHEYDGITGDHLAVYEPTNTAHLAMRLIPAPALETVGFETGAITSLCVTASGEIGRYYGISQGPTLTSTAWSVALTNALATNSWPRLCVTNAPASPSRFYGVFECGF